MLSVPHSLLRTQNSSTFLLMGLQITSEPDDKRMYVRMPKTQKLDEKVIVLGHSPGPVPAPPISSSLGCLKPSNPPGSSMLKHAYRLFFRPAPEPPTTATWPDWGPPTRRTLTSGVFWEL